MVAQQREDRGTAPRRLLEELLRALPAGARDVDLVASAEALDHDRQPACLPELDEQLLVLGIESSDHALREVGDRATAGQACLVHELAQLLARGEAARDRASVPVHLR